MNHLKTLTDKLAELRFHMDEIDAGYTETMEPLKQEKLLLEHEILSELKGQGLHSTPETSYGEYFIRSYDTTYNVVDEDKARLWGLKNDAIRLDKTLANSILRKMPLSRIPPCFQAIDKDKLTIKRPALDEEAPAAVLPAPKPAKAPAKNPELVTVALKPTKHAATKKLQKK